jgi:hypothetical protein
MRRGDLVEIILMDPVHDLLGQELILILSAGLVSKLRGTNGADAEAAVAGAGGGLVAGTFGGAGSVFRTAKTSNTL